MLQPVCPCNPKNRFNLNNVFFCLNKTRYRYLSIDRGIHQWSNQQFSWRSADFFGNISFTTWLRYFVHIVGTRYLHVICVRFVDFIVFARCPVVRSVSAATLKLKIEPNCRLDVVLRTTRCSLTYVPLKCIECSRFGVNHTVLILYGILNRQTKHFVQLVFVVIGPCSGSNFGDQNDQQTAEKLFRGQSIFRSFFFSNLMSAWLFTYGY